jgi:hypothetical protein
MNANPLSFGLVDGRPVFMDEQGDSYFVLDEPAEAEFLRAVVRCGEPPASSASPIVHALGGATVILAQGPRPTRTLLDKVGQQTGTWIADSLRIAVQIWRTKRSIRGTPIAELLSALQKKTNPAPMDEAAMLAQAARFLAARRLVPVPSHCLSDSLALLRWLQNPAGMLLVFGVKLEPFAAHCWVQFGETLLNDHLDHVAPFQPVRVIRC